MCVVAWRLVWKWAWSRDWQFVGDRDKGDSEMFLVHWICVIRESQIGRGYIG